MVGVETSQIFRLVVAPRTRRSLVEEISGGRGKPQQPNGQKEMDTRGQQVKLKGTVAGMVCASVNTVGNTDELDRVDKLPCPKTAQDQDEYLSRCHSELLTI